MKILNSREILTDNSRKLAEVLKERDKLAAEVEVLTEKIEAMEM